MISFITLTSTDGQQLNKQYDHNDFQIDVRAPDKLCICVFYAMKTSKNACIIRSECTFMHRYCCVSKLSKFGAYLYAVDDNTSCT